MTTSQPLLGDLTIVLDECPVLVTTRFVTEVTGVKILRPDPSEEQEVREGPKWQERGPR